MTNIKIQKSGGSILLDNYYEHPSPIFTTNLKTFDFNSNKQTDIDNSHEFGKNIENVSQPDPTLVL